jgi:hypothetical protein
VQPRIDDDIPGLDVGVTDPSRVHVVERARDLREDEDYVGDGFNSGTVERQTASVLHQKLDADRAKQPVAVNLEGVDFDEIGMIEEPGHAELVAGLIEKLPISERRDRHDLQCILVCISRTVNAQHATARARAEFRED